MITLKLKIKTTRKNDSPDKLVVSHLSADNLESFQVKSLSQKSDTVFSQ